MLLKSRIENYWARRPAGESSQVENYNCIVKCSSYFPCRKGYGVGSLPSQDRWVQLTVVGLSSLMSAEVHPLIKWIKAEFVFLGNQNWLQTNHGTGPQDCLLYRSFIKFTVSQCCFCLQWQHDILWDIQEVSCWHKGPSVCITGELLWPPLRFQRTILKAWWFWGNHRITESQNSRGWKGPLWVI